MKLLVSGENRARRSGAGITLGAVGFVQTQGSISGTTASLQAEGHVSTSCPRSNT